MKTELKTAEQHLLQSYIDNDPDGDFDKDVFFTWRDECQNEHNSVIKAIESHTSERLDHLRQQLEAEEKECITPTYCNGIRKAISLIDQLKAETKNT